MKGLRPSGPHSLGHVRASTAATSLRSSDEAEFFYAYAVESHAVEGAEVLREAVEDGFHVV